MPENVLMDFICECSPINCFKPSTLLAPDCGIFWGILKYIMLYNGQFEVLWDIMFLRVFWCILGLLRGEFCYIMTCYG